MNYSKRPITIAQQIALLKQRGLIIDNEANAETALNFISYFRLADYWRTLEADATTHQFLPNSHFSYAIQYYNFDKQLRALLFAAIQTIEIAIRTKIIHHFSLSHDSFWFIDAHLFADHSLFSSHLETLNRELQRSKEEFITSHYRKYGKEEFPPAWKTLEVASLGTLSKLFSNFSDRSVKNSIAHDLGLKQHLILRSWLLSITALRNCLAHHSRIWNRRFPTIPILPRKMVNNWISNRQVLPYKIYPQLCCIVYWLNAIDSQNTFVADFKKLLAMYPIVNTHSMGFPTGWQSEPLWR